MKHWAARVVIAVLVWSAIGAVLALPYILIGRGADAIFRYLVEWCLWGAIAPLINMADQRLSGAGMRPARFLGSHVALGLSVMALQVGMAATLQFYLGVHDFDPWADPLEALDRFLRSGLVYCLILGALKTFKYYRRHHLHELELERLEQRFLETRLNALRMQLDPHFLFNSLNGISAYVGYEPKLARKMLEHLGDLLRLSLETRNRQEVTLAEEISFLDHYLALHRMRFDDRLSFTVTVMADVVRARIPSLLLQPLVENAIKHGIGGRASGGSIVISARRVDGKVDIRVVDDGVGLPPHWTMEAAPGLGLSVTRERLLAMYPGGASDFAVVPHAGGGTEARILLPLAMA